MFLCNKCGMCCRNLDKSDLYKELDRGDGVCIYLKDDLCSIYETRPLLCRIGESYDVFFKNTYEKDEYYRLNKKVCQKINSKRRN